MSSKQELICWKSRRMRSKSGTPPPLGALTHLGGSHKKWKGTGDLGAGTLIGWGCSWYKRNRKNKNWQDQKTKSYQKSRSLSPGGDSYVKTPNPNHNRNKVTQICCRLSAVKKIQERKPNSKFPTKVYHLQIICSLSCEQQDMFQNCLFSPSSSLNSLSPHCNSESVAGQAGQKWPALHMSRDGK